MMDNGRISFMVLWDPALTASFAALTALPDGLELTPIGASGDGGSTASIVSPLRLGRRSTWLELTCVITQGGVSAIPVPTKSV